MAFDTDGRSVLATFNDGVRFLDAATGKRGAVLEEKDSYPTAVGVFRDPLAASREVRLHRVIFANRSCYFVKVWLDSGAPSTITLWTSVKVGGDSDDYAVPLAVDPDGRSAIVTGPVDRATGKNILWAWTAGNREAGTPGNRLLKGHDAVVVTAAWSHDGKTAVTGDAGGRVIIWDAQTMKEAHRVELGARAAAVAVSPDGKKLAAVAVGKQAKFYAWDSTTRQLPQPTLADTGDYSGPVHACLAFSPDGRQLIGSAINTADWLNRPGRLVGTIHVWKAAKAAK